MTGLLPRKQVGGGSSSTWAQASSAMEVQQKFDVHQVGYLKKETSVGLIRSV